MSVFERTEERMVSFQTPLSPNRRKMITELESSSKKRKCEDEMKLEKLFEIKRSRVDIKESKAEIELNLETPLPLEWQRCLDIQSGQIHFYNTRTHKRTARDPRQSPDPPSPSHMSLELELNLPCESLRRNRTNNSRDYSKNSTENNRNNEKQNLEGLKRSPSWLAFEGDNDQEMVAAVCVHCHMLVMLCKSSPACPHCKFVNPPNQSPVNLFKPRVSLLCCKD